MKLLEVNYLRNNYLSPSILAEIALVICDREEKAIALLENKEKGVTPTLSCLVLFNNFNDALLDRGKNCGVEILHLSQLMVRLSGTEKVIYVTNTRGQETMLNCSLLRHWVWHVQ